MKMIEKILIFVTLIILINFVNSQVDIDNAKSCPYDRIFEPDKTICCENLNKRRTEFAKCCKYPILVIYRDDYEFCVKNCTDPASNSAPDRCCVMPCCFKKLGILTEDMKDISTEGLINSFSMSVNNSESWREAIVDVVESCTEAIKQPPNPNDYSNYWDCFEKIPFYFYDIVDCAYDYNFLKCPNFPFNQDSCYESYYYVYDCFLNGTNILSSPLSDPRMENEEYISAGKSSSNSDYQDYSTTDPSDNATYYKPLKVENGTVLVNEINYNDYFN